MTMLATLGGVCALRDEWKGLCQPRLLDVHQFMAALGVSPAARPSVLQVAQRCHATPYPPHWSEELDAASGGIYFYNSLRDEALWEHPLSNSFQEVLQLVQGFVTDGLSIEDLAPRIEAEMFESQQRAVKDLADWVGPLGGTSAEPGYFYNRRTGESEWEDPRERWQYDLHVRYDLLVGFLVAQERDVRERDAPQARAPELELTPTLTSLASTLSSIASSVSAALPEPSASDQAHAAADDGSAEVWARPRTPRFGSLPLPPRIADEPAARVQYSNVAPHQQRYASDVAQSSSTGFQPSKASVAPSRSSPPPPPPPPNAPPRGRRL